ncbi:MAG: RNA polymerase sigma factor [Bacteroidales bacterium]
MAATDAELVRRALNGHQDAARDLVERFERPVFNLIVRMVRDPGVAEELAQDTFVKAFSHLRSYEPARKFSSWIFRIAHNTTIDYLRRPDRVVSSLDEGGHGTAEARSLTSAEPGPQAIAERNELAGLVERAISGLRADYREALVLRYQEELSYEEIAEVLGLPIGTVKSNIHRARAELAAAMRSAGWGG